MDLKTILQLEGLGLYSLMLRDVVQDIARKGLNLYDLMRQITLIGTNSVPIVLLTASFTGMVLAIQTAYGLQRFGAKLYVGNIVSLSLVRELGPVLAAIMLSGRVGASIAAELGSMAVTEQIDAIRALGANPIRKLVSPRIVAGLIVLPLLTVLADIVGIFGGGLIAVYELEISAHVYYRSVVNFVMIRDVLDGLIKSAFFGFILVSIACYKGINCRGGTEGVGEAVRSAVVTGSIYILISDFFLTKFLISLW